MSHRRNNVESSFCRDKFVRGTSAARVYVSECGGIMQDDEQEAHIARLITAYRGIARGYNDDDSGIRLSALKTDSSVGVTRPPMDRHNPSILGKKSNQPRCALIQQSAVKATSNNRTRVLSPSDLLTPSTPAVPNCCCSRGSAPCWSNPPF